MQQEDLRTAVTDLVLPVVIDHGAELVDVEVVGNPNSQVVRLLVHRDPGISVDLCEQISREVADILDVVDPMPGRYRLEVTSPGLGRPLRSDRDFERARQRRVKVVTRTGRTLRGILRRWDSASIALDTEDDSYQEQVVQREEIAKATIAPEL